jgi:hypothetical protein
MDKSSPKNQRNQQKLDFFHAFVRELLSALAGESE